VIALARLIYSFALAHWGVIVTALAAFMGWANNLSSAFFAALPNPDNPADWPCSKYRVFYRTIGNWNNQKPPFIPLPPIHPQEMLPPKL
jgi:hypothetical protein